MDNDTTTEAPVESGATIQGVQVDDQGQAVAEPTETEQAEAEEQATETPEQQAEEAPSEPSEDDQLAEWAEKKGLKLDSENATKAAKMAREAEKAMHQKAQRASELEKTLTSSSDEVAEEVAQNTGQDPELLKRLQRVEVKESVRDFWDSNPEARQYEPKMIEELQRSPHLAGDLRALYAVVKANDLEAVKSQGKREALESLAHKQTAAVPTGNAVNGASLETATITPENVDELVGKNSVEWFKKNQDAINKAMAA